MERVRQRTTPGRAFDLLRAPVLGRFLRWVHARTILQAILLALAALVILDGLFGPQIAPRNLAGVLPWVHWRGFIVLALLVAGNLFCMACPFMLPRRLAKRVLPADRPWPRKLRSKWLALGLLVLFFWAYEAFALWQSPWLTAWVALSYFAAAFVIDGFFRGAAFCKHVCPIGQFHFVHSTLSPLEVRTRDPEVCARCRTKDCIRGRYAPAPRREAPEPSPVGAAAPEGPLRLDASSGTVVLPAARGPEDTLIQRGCELWLFQERKVGNMDCTFCMECIHACPHDNVGILARPLGRELWDPSRRSGIGRFGDRVDLAALAAFLAFAAFVNAFGMVRPVHRVLETTARLLGSPPEPVVLFSFFIAALLLVPASTVLGAASLSRRLSGRREPLLGVATRYAYALVPLGLGMWTAHYLYHFLVGGWTVVPLTHTYLADLGLLSPPDAGSGWGPMVPEGWLFPLQVLLLQGGLLGTLWVSLRIARREHGRTRSATRAFLPWALLGMFLFAVGVWLLLQPMEMRGTFMMVG